MKPIFKFLLAITLGSVFQISTAQQIHLNEISSVNTSTIIDAYGDYSDWIELYNSGSETIDLKGYYLSDNLENTSKWEFPDVSISPNSYLLVFASEKNSVEGELHANFKLSKDGEVLSLYNNSGILIDQLDSVLLKADVSYGRSVHNGELVFYQNPSPGTVNSSSEYEGVLEKVNINLPSGLYPHSIELIADHISSDVAIRYTLDATEPNENSSLFAESLELFNVENQENIVSMIPTNPSFDYPEEGFDEDRANTRGWLPPYEKVNKSNVLKIKAFKNNFIPSETTTATYFINPDTSSRYNLPMVFIASEPDGFFSDETGIYVYGTTGLEGNYKETGIEWERPVNMHYFNNEGEFEFEQQFGARIHGGGGRHSTIKNLRLYARDDYGKSSLKYPFFTYDDIDEFKRFMVRGPGHRPDCAPRDDLADLLIQNFNMDIQHIQPVIVFLNGEYWGIHTIKERFDQKYLELKYGKKDDDYVIMRNWGYLDAGEEGDDEPYYNLLDFVSSVDMSQNENYEYVKTQIDIDNYLDYFTAEVFMGNVDWVNTNIKFWRYKGLDKNTKSINGLDGKWRWFMFDFDLVFGGSCKDISPFVNVLSNAFDPEYGIATELAIGLKQNQQFNNDFVNRMCDHVNSTFNEKHFLEQIDEIDTTMTPHMLEHVARWRYPSTSDSLALRLLEEPNLDQWNYILSELRNYPEERKRKIFEHLTDEFSLADSIHIELNVNDQTMGNVQVNSLFISEATPGVKDEVYPWNGAYFQNVPITLMAIPQLGYRFVEWQETGETNDTIVLDIDYSIKYTAIFEEDPDFVFEDVLYINEFMASNKSTITDEFNAHADWVEIYNPNNSAVDLASFYLSDDLENPYKYQFERGSKETIIPAYGFKIIWCDDNEERGVLHTSFKLSASGEDIVLTAPDSTRIDELSYGDQDADVSYGREKDGEENWKLFVNPIGPTPGATNNNASINKIPNDEIEFYPNPVKQGHLVYFQEKSNVKVFDLLGRLTLQIEDTRSISTRDLNQGMYIVQLNNKANRKLLVE
jgi:hypothetical protein